MMLEPGKLIPMGFNKACGKHNLTILWCFVLQHKLHTFTIQTVLSIYFLQIYVFENKCYCSKNNIFSVSVCAVYVLDQNNTVLSS